MKKFRDKIKMLIKQQRGKIDRQIKKIFKKEMNIKQIIKIVFKQKSICVNNKVFVIE